MSHRGDRTLYYWPAGLTSLGQNERVKYSPEELARVFALLHEGGRHARDSAIKALDPSGDVHDRHAHPDPARRIAQARADRAVRQLGWREALYRAALNACDPANNAGQWTWMSWFGWCSEGTPEYWDLSKPFTLPTAIPRGTPTAEDRAEWMPETTLHEVEHAASLELELHMGGPASMLLHGQLTDPGQKRLRARATVETYLMRNRQQIPADPYDPNEWGHDARLRALSLQDISANRPVTFRPAFDPEVLEYTTGQPIAPPLGITATTMDTLAPAPAHRFLNSNAVLEVIVTAKDGVTKRTYKVSVEG